MDKTCYVGSCNSQARNKPETPRLFHTCSLSDDQYVQCISKLFNIDIEQVRAIKEVADNG